jgi:hypothetical protein
MLSTYFRNQILDQFLRDGLYVSLHTKDPGATGAHELVGYERASVRGFGPAGEGFKASAEDITLRELPACTVGYIGLWDAEKKGRFLMGGSIGTPKIIQTGDSLRFEPGKLGFAIEE